MSIHATKINTKLAVNEICEPPYWDEFLCKIPFCNLIQENYCKIFEELKSFINLKHPFMDYPKYGNLYARTWEAFPLSLFEGEFIAMAKEQLGFDLDAFVREARQQLPITSKLLNPLENQGDLRNVFISRLLPGSEIYPHKGWTQDFLRIHLGLVCDPLCTITIGSVTKTWAPGKFLAFKDGGPYLHSVSHRGTQERIVMSFDLRLGYAAQFIPNLIN